MTTDPNDQSHTPEPSGLTRRGVLISGLGAAAVGAVNLSSASASRPNQGLHPAGAKVVRTPSRRFDGLPDYPFNPNYVAVGDRPGLRMHYIDERPGRGVKPSGETIVLLHGNPSWSYLWRHVIPPLVAAGHRCIAPDLIGFGKSDKVVDPFEHTYENQMAWLHEALFVQLDLRAVTLVCHDFGGLFGLPLLAQNPGRFARVVATNTGLDTGEEDRGPAWQYLAEWLQFTQRTQPYPSGQIVDMFSATSLDPAVRAAYDAPFPEEEYVGGPRRLPLLIPLTVTDENSPMLIAAWEVLQDLEVPFLCAFSDQDHASNNGDHSSLSGRIAGARNQPHVTIAGAKHFLQEDQPGALAAVIDGFVRTTAPSTV